MIAHPPESRVPIYAAIVAAALLHLALPAEVAPGPRWLPIAIVVPLLIPHALSHGWGHHRTARRIGIAAMGALTAFLVGALLTLIWRLLFLPSSHNEGTLILRAAVPLWMGNVTVFALWYWRLDAVGPHVRERGHACGHGFVFPQMTMDASLKERLGFQKWSPTFLDYLFIAFNTSTALSPTDTMVVRPWAKALSMVQSSVSLTLLVVVAARAVNIL